MLRCSAVYLTGTYGATGGARANALPLPYFPDGERLRKKSEQARASEEKLCQIIGDHDQNIKTVTARIQQTQKEKIVTE